MIRIDRTGRNRLVIVTRRWAVKLPSLRTWREFLFGLLNNLNEAEWANESAAYCPVVWAAPLGLAIVMPRAEVLDVCAYAIAAPYLPELAGVEHKASSWGVLDGRFVAVDYGWR